ncbi:MAG: TIR domain-containing protein, partial [Symploca sp. SIO2G7]|nr:TIR domain-containing protein [Symploca sp. SIO2G7]
DRAITERVRRILMRAGITTWTHHTDIAHGSDFESAMNQGVEESDNVLFLMSPAAFQSQYCQQELAKALELNKRIIPLQIKPVNLTQVPERLRNLQHIDLTTCHSEAEYQYHTRDLLRILQQDVSYYREHKVLLTKALKWQQHRNPCILLRGYELRHALAWLTVAKKRPLYGPTPLHREFIAESQQQPAEVYPDIFISYSRVESGFARKLNDRLQQHGKRTWFDQESIASGADFKAEIYKGIAASNYFLFILSRRSVRSSYCADEVEYAAKLNKQIVTILHEPVNTEILHPGLAKVQWIDFTAHSADFTASFQELIRRLDTDSDHLEMHRRLLLRALEWEHKQRRPDFLLQGNDLTEAEQWLLEAFQKQPLPTELQREYLAASRTFFRRRQRTWTAVLSSLLTVAILAGGFAWHQSERALAARDAEKNQREKAEQKEQEALESRDHALKAQAAEKRQRRKAEQEEDKAIQARNDAIAAQAAEKEQREIAEQKQQEAIEARNRAEAARDDQKKQRIRAEIQTRIAQENAQIAQVQAYLSQTETFLLNKKPMEGMIAAIKAGENIQTVGELSKTATAYALAALQQVTYPYLDAGPTTPTIFRERNRLDQQTRVRSVSFSPNGQLIVSGGEDGTLKLWNANGQPINTLQGHQKLVKSVDFSPNGQLIVSGSEDGTLKLWDSAGNRLKTLRDDSREDFSSVSFSADGQLIASSSSRDGITSTIKLWSLSGKTLAILRDEPSFIVSISFSPDSRHLALASKDGTVKLWDRNGRLIGILTGHDDDVRTVSFSPDGQLIASGSKDKTVKIWTRTGELMATLRDHQDTINSVSFSLDSQLIASGSRDETVKIWTRTGELMATLRGHRGEIKSVSFGETGIASGSTDGTIKLWHPYEPPIIKTKGSQVPDPIVSFSPDGQLVASVGQDSRTIQLRTRAGQQLGTLTGHKAEVYSVEFSPNGRLIVSGGRDQTVRLWSRSRRLLKTFKGHQGDVNSVGFSPDSRTIVSGSDDTTVKLWSVNGDPTPTTLRGHRGRVFSVSFAPDGQTLASGGYDRTVKLWSRQTGTEIATLVDHKSPVVGVRFIHDGQILLSRDENGTINRWDRSLESLLRRNCSWLQSYLKYNQVGKQEAKRGLCQSF